MSAPGSDSGSLVDPRIGRTASAATCNGFFGEDQVQIWHLRQLRRSDVESAARTEGVDVNALIQAIHLRNATALAAKPVTLRMLLGRYRTTGTLPTMQADLYRQGVLELCKEPNQKRVDKDAPEWVGRLTPDQRHAVARRIAGFSILCQRPFVQTRHRAGEPVPEGCLALSDLCGREKVGGTELNVDEAAVTEVLGCALFQGSGSGVVSWSHQTYAEFLAAEWLNSHRLPDRQLSSLIHPPGDGGDRVAPQLREMVAWLASLDLQLGRSLMEANPDVLMRSDVLAGDEETRCQLAGLFLDSVESGIILGPSQNYPYARFAAEGLGDVLRPYITAKALRYDTRYCALQIAQECSCQSLADDLVAFALDEGNEPYLRQLALLALREVAVERHLAAIQPLRAHGNEELQAIAIGILWPASISTAEALEHLRPTQNRSLIGWHHQLINEDISKNLPERNLATALDWMAGFVRRHPDASCDSGCRDFAELACKLWREALPRVSEPEVMDAIVRLADALRRSHHWLWAKPNDNHWSGPDDVEARHSLAYRMLMAFGGGDNVAFALMDEFHMVQPDDVPWLVSRLDAESDFQLAACLVQLIGFCRPNEGAHFELVYDAMFRHPELSRHWAAITGYIRLDSRAADSARRVLARSKAPLKAENNGPSPEVVQADSTRFLQMALAGDASGWIEFVDLLLSGAEHRSLHAYDSGFEALWGWQHLDAHTRVTVVPAAEAYLTSGQPGANHARMSYGYRALEHLEAVAPDILDRLPAELWQRWAPAVLAHWFNNDETLAPRLAARSYAAAPEAFRQAFRIFTFPPAHNLKGIWDDELGRILAERLTVPGLTDYALSDAVRLLIGHGHPDGQAFVRAALEGRIRGLRRASVVAAALQASHGRLWGEIWPYLQAEPVFGVTTLLVAGQRDEEFEMVSLSEGQWADAFLHLHRYTRPEGEARDWNRVRSDPLRILAKSGTKAGLLALERIRAAAPELDYIGRFVIECRENMRRRTWEPSTPQELLELIDKSDRRLVRSGEELLDVLQEALGRYEAELHAQQPSVGDLWNTKPYTPKEENELSDHLVRFLRRDLEGRRIIVNREVEVRPPGRGGEAGERTDIHVNAVAGDDVITVVIEVKGAWHQHVNAAMQTQLADRYLGESGHRYGMYVVFWFECGVWVTADDRRAAAKRHCGTDIGAVRTKFCEQATSLSGEARHIRSVVVDAAWRSVDKPPAAKKPSGRKKNGSSPIIADNPDP